MLRDEEKDILGNEHRIYEKLTKKCAKVMFSNRPRFGPFPIKSLKKCYWRR